jgi:hypothetical protein
MALQLAQAEIKAANQKAMIQGGTKAITAGAMYGAQAGWFGGEESFVQQPAGGPEYQGYPEMQQTYGSGYSQPYPGFNPTGG